MTELNQLDNTFAEAVSKRPGGENIRNCFSCGACTAGCPISAIRPGYNPRKIIRQTLLGFRMQVLASRELWHCLQCHACVSHCPQDVRFADILRVLRQMAVEEGCVQPETARKLDMVNDELYRRRIEIVEGIL